MQQCGEFFSRIAVIQCTFHFDVDHNRNLELLRGRAQYDLGKVFPCMQTAFYDRDREIVNSTDKIFAGDDPFARHDERFRNNGLNFKVARFLDLHIQLHDRVFRNI